MKIYRDIQIWINGAKILGALHEDLSAYVLFFADGINFA
jgi:hypothetical protein